jgi:hypothetical protein
VPKIVEVDVPYERIVYVETPVEKTVYKDVEVPQYLSNEFVRTKVIFVCDLLDSGYS